MRKFVFVAFIVALMISSVSLIAAQSDNWCNPGQPWGDGRCEKADPNLTAYYWQMGWYHAHKMDASALEPASGATAVDDYYSYHDNSILDCRFGQTVPAADGLLANDASGLQVTGYTQPIHGDVVVWPDGSFRYNVTHSVDKVTFEYTVTGGDIATVELHMDCEEGMH